MSPGSGISSFLSSKLSGLFFDDDEAKDQEKEASPKENEAKTQDFERKKKPAPKESTESKSKEKAESKNAKDDRVDVQSRSEKRMDAIRQETFEWDPHADFDKLLETLDSLNPDAREHGFKMLDGLVDENKVACVAIFSKNKDARDAAIERLERNPELLSIIYSESQYKDTSEEAL